MFEQIKRRVAFYLLVTGTALAGGAMLALIIQLYTGSITEMNMPVLLFVAVVLLANLIDKLRKGF